VSGDEVDPAHGLVEIEHTIVRITGVCLPRNGIKSPAGERTRRLPAFAVAMLRRYNLPSAGRGPVLPDSTGVPSTRPPRTQPIRPTGMPPTTGFR
jgi:hypothetical protein